MRHGLSQHHRPLRPGHVKAGPSSTSAIKSRSVESLKVSRRSGCSGRPARCVARPTARSRHAAPTQCVPSAGRFERTDGGDFGTGVDRAGRTGPSPSPGRDRAGCDVLVLQAIGTCLNNPRLRRQGLRCPPPSGQRSQLGPFSFAQSPKSRLTAIRHRPTPQQWQKLANRPHSELSR